MSVIDCLWFRIQYKKHNKLKLIIIEKKLSYAPGIAAFMAGLASGMLGTGSSTIQMPFLLSAKTMGNNAKAASATSSFLALCTESIALILFILLKDVELHRAMVYSVTAFIGALLGQFVVFQVTQNDARKWFIALLLILYIGTGLVLILYISVRKIDHDIGRGWTQYEHFLGPCSDRNSNW